MGGALLEGKAMEAARWGGYTPIHNDADWNGGRSRLFPMEDESGIALPALPPRPFLKSSQVVEAKAEAELLDFRSFDAK